MAVSKETIRGWLKCGKEKSATHMIVVCDTYDHTDYPVYVGLDANVREIEAQYNMKNMQRVMEVYNLSLDFEAQLNQYRAFNY